MIIGEKVEDPGRYFVGFTLAGEYLVGKERDEALSYPSAIDAVSVWKPFSNEKGSTGANICFVLKNYLNDKDTDKAL
jgi:hypothetical protein